MVFDPQRNLIIGVENTAGKEMDPATLPTELSCEIPFLNTQIYLQIESGTKDTLISYKTTGDEFTPCFTLPKSLTDTNILVAANTSATDTQTYDIYNLQTEISDDMMGPIMEMIAEIQEGMKEEVADLSGEVKEITGALSELPTKEKLSELINTIVKTRE